MQQQLRQSKNARWMTFGSGRDYVGELSVQSGSRSGYNLEMPEVQYTKEEFVAALTEAWSDVPLLLEQTPLPRVCQVLAVDAFVQAMPDSSAAIKMLREQLGFVEYLGHFVFKEVKKIAVNVQVEKAADSIELAFDPKDVDDG